MHKIVRLVAASALLLIGAVSTAKAGGWYSGYPYGGFGYYGAGYYGASSCGCGACGCGGYFGGYGAQWAYEARPPIYVVNQGPTYTGPAISVPILNYWSRGAVRAYPYIHPGYDYDYPRYYEGPDWHPASYAPAYPRYVRPRVLHRPYYPRRVLRVYGAADPRAIRAPMNRCNVEPRDLPIQ